ncbi:MAG: hypothetical protein HY043_08810 [Verrucomicrobia bacterium]|nr:hypothetical protein [Verrucomicrobiota bacterium]
MNQRLQFHRLARSFILSAGLVAALTATGAAPVAQTAASVTKAPIVIPQSVFVDDLTKGKDPFFPGTVRRVDKTAVAAATAANTTANPAKPKVELVQLKGILDGANRRLALINNHTFAAGEQAEVKTLSGNLRLQCVEIRAHSVVVLLNGETQRRELHLHEKH